jgi:hypothetical protein
MLEIDLLNGETLYFSWVVDGVGIEKESEEEGGVFA